MYLWHVAILAAGKIFLHSQKDKSRSCRCSPFCFVGRYHMTLRGAVDGISTIAA